MFMITLSFKYKMPQIQLGLIHTLTYTLKLTVRTGSKRIFPIVNFHLFVATFQ